ncbi:uncharacterized protein BDCG_02642, partial [Blastomyces dermatitidis ER-3]
MVKVTEESVEKSERGDGDGDGDGSEEGTEIQYIAPPSLYKYTHNPLSVHVITCVCLHYKARTLGGYSGVTGCGTSQIRNGHSQTAAPYRPIPPPSLIR